MLTGSRIGLARECAHWLHAAEHPPDDSPEARFGTAVHAGCASLDPAWQPPETLTPAEQERARRCVRHVLAWCMDWFPSAKPATEQGYRYRPVTGAARRGSARGARWYDDVRGGEIPLTIDAVIDDGTLTVVELKTGKRRDAHVWQSRTGALAASRCWSAPAVAYSTDDVTAVLLYVSEDGVFPVVEHLDVFDLADHARALRELWEGLPDRTEPTPGPHCTELHCPLRSVCPATRAALARAVPAFPSTEITSDAEALAVLNGLPMALAALDGWAGKLKSYVRARPLALADNRIYGWREHQTRRVAKLTAERIQAAKDVLGPLADVAVQQTLDASVGSLEGAALTLARQRAAADPAVKIGAETERIMGALVDAGVLTVSEHERCEVFKPEKPARRSNGRGKE